MVRGLVGEVGLLLALLLGLLLALLLALPLALLQTACACKGKGLVGEVRLLLGLLLAVLLGLLLALLQTACACGRRGSRRRGRTSVSFTTSFTTDTLLLT